MNSKTFKRQSNLSSFVSSVLVGLLLNACQPSGSSLNENRTAPILNSKNPVSKNVIELFKKKRTEEEKRRLALVAQFKSDPNESTIVSFLKNVSKEPYSQSEDEARKILVELYSKNGRVKDAVNALEERTTRSGMIHYFDLEDYVLSHLGRDSLHQLRNKYKKFVAGTEPIYWMERYDLTLDQAYEYIRTINNFKNQEEYRKRFIHILEQHPKNYELWWEFLGSITPEQDVWKYMYLVEDWYKKSDMDQRKVIREHFNIDWKKLESEEKP